jgi:hypothetical protein
VLQELSTVGPCAGLTRLGIVLFENTLKKQIVFLACFFGNVLKQAKKTICFYSLLIFGVFERCTFDSLIRLLTKVPTTNSEKPAALIST